LDIKRLPINRLLLIAETRARAWRIFQSALYRSQFFPLNSFVSDVKAHLRELQSTQSCAASERGLILVRVGLFDEDGDDMVISPDHRALLGVKYCPSRKCQRPLHGRRKVKLSRTVNLKMSKKIKETRDVLAPRRLR